MVELSSCSFHQIQHTSFDSIHSATFNQTIHSIQNMNWFHLLIDSAASLFFIKETKSSSGAEERQLITHNFISFSCGLFTPSNQFHLFLKIKRFIDWPIWFRFIHCVQSLIKFNYCYNIIARQLTINFNLFSSSSSIKKPTNWIQYLHSIDFIL